MKTFEEAWDEKEREGFSYGHDALEQVHLGWEMRAACEKLTPTGERPTWPEVWMNVATEISRRSCDPALKVGAIVVPEDNTGILSLGYNGMWKGGPNEVESLERGKSGTIHAELNAIIKLDFNSHKARRMYVTHSPCRDCSKIIVNACINSVVYNIPYRDTSGLDILKEVGIEVLTLQEAIDGTR